MDGLRKLNTLIIVDMQKDFIDGSLANPLAQAIVEPLCTTLDNNAVHFDRVLLTRDTHDYTYLFTEEGRNLPVPHCINGTEGWLVDKRIRDVIESRYSNRVPVEYVNKPTFGYIDWYRYVEPSYNGIFTVVGTCTDICVISNVLILKALFPNATVEVIGNLCAGLTEEKHKAALEVMKSCQVKVTEVTFGK